MYLIFFSLLNFLQSLSKKCLSPFSYKAQIKNNVIISRVCKDTLAYSIDYWKSHNSLRLANTLRSICCETRHDTLLKSHDLFIEKKMSRHTIMTTLL